MQQPRLRDARNLAEELYPINKLPKDKVVRIAGHIVYLLHTDRHDMTGDDWGDIFAEVIGGEHYSSPVGIADVAKGKMAWSMKTVKNSRPFTATSLRLISGRCSPDYSFGIEDTHADIQKTGEAVLAIWNARVDIALAHFTRVRVNVLVRNADMTSFTLFEEYLEHFNIADYEWRENRNGNFEGFNRQTGAKCFAWQPHGAQFTILTNVPDDVIRFRVRKPGLLPREKALADLGFDPSWVEFC